MDADLPLRPRARLIDTSVPPAPEGVVLVLHGGASRRDSPQVSPAQLSVLRMIPVARRVARVAEGRLAVIRLLNSHRGWNGERTPVQDVSWALAEIARRWGPELGVCLVGHSLGARAALLSAAQPQVKGVVALAPWVYGDDVPARVSRTRIVIIHGDADQVASPDRSRQVARSLRRQTAVSYVTVTGGTHAMLRRRDSFDRLAADCVAWMLLDVVTGPLLRRISAGEPDLVV